MTTQRCEWVANAPALYQEYHDVEWGKPLRGDQALFERIALEAFQAGLSWWAVLRRREALRTAFADFNPKVLVAWDETDVERLARDESIIRNRAKIRSVITNARALDAMKPGELTELVWSFAPEVSPLRQNVSELPAVTPESTAMARSLKLSGFVFLGPTTCYALMQACGLVNDHVAHCSFR